MQHFWHALFYMVTSAQSNDSMPISVKKNLYLLRYVVDVKCFRVITQASKGFQIPLIILKCQWPDILYVVIIYLGD